MMKIMIQQHLHPMTTISVITTSNGMYINNGMNNTFIQKEKNYFFKHNILIVNIFSFYRGS